MTSFLFAVAGFLLLTVLVGLLRALTGPTARDRVASLLLLSTTGVAVLAVLASATEQPALRDAAIALVALATLAVLTLVRRESVPQ